MNRKTFIREIFRIVVFEGPPVLLLVVLAGKNYPKEAPWSLLFTILLYVYFGLVLVSFPTCLLLSRKSVRNPLIRAGWRIQDLETIGFFWNVASVGLAVAVSSCLQGSDGFVAKHQEMFFSMFVPLIVFYMVNVVVTIGVSILLQRAKEYFY